MISFLLDFSAYFYVSSGQTYPRPFRFLSRRNSLFDFFCINSQDGEDGGSFSAFCWAQRQQLFKHRFSAVSWLNLFAEGLELRRAGAASRSFHKLYKVRGDFGAIWRVFSAKLALRASFFSRQDSAASAASNRRFSSAKMIRRRSRIALKLQFIGQFWIIIGK